MVGIENIILIKVAKIRKVNNTDTSGIKSKFAIIEIIENSPNDNKQIGIPAICAERTAPSDLLSLSGKNFSNLDIGFESKIIPNTTVNES